jgi:hypothetical protein
MSNVEIKYEFIFTDQTTKSYAVNLDKDTLSLVPSKNDKPADWTKLENHQCSHCPLKPQDHPHCPVARNMSDLVTDFADKISYTEAVVKVTTSERIYIHKVSLQDGIFSIFGLVMATSGCPYMEFLKPMARFHLPFSTSEETIVRSVSMYLLRQFFVAKHGGEPDWNLQKLDGLYKDIQKVNQGILSRIRGLAKGDADANAITVLHSFSTLLSMAISSDLSKIDPLFKQAAKTV